MKKITKTFLTLVVAFIAMFVCLFVISPTVSARQVIIDDDIFGPQYNTYYYQYNGTGFKVSGNKADDSYISGNRIVTPVYKGAYIPNTSSKWFWTSWSSWSTANKTYYDKAQNNNYSTYRGDTVTEYLAESRTVPQWINTFTGATKYSTIMPSLLYKKTGLYQLEYRYKARSMSWDKYSGGTYNEYAPRYYGLYYYGSSTPIKKGILAEYHKFDYETVMYTSYTDAEDTYVWYLPIKYDRDKAFIDWLHNDYCCATKTQRQVICSGIHDIGVGVALDVLGKYSSIGSLAISKTIDIVDIFKDIEENKIDTTVKGLDKLLWNDIKEYRTQEFILKFTISTKTNAKTTYNFDYYSSYGNGDYCFTKSTFDIDIIRELPTDLNYVVDANMNNDVYTISYITDYDYFKTAIQNARSYDFSFGYFD